MEEVEAPPEVFSHEKGGGCVSSEDVLHQLVNLCILSDLVSHQINYGEELHRRMMEIKVDTA